MMIGVHSGCGRFSSLHEPNAMRVSGAADSADAAGADAESGRCPVHAASSSAAARARERRTGRIVIIQS